MPNINSLTYNGMKSTDLGVYVTGSGSFDAAEMDADKYEIAGRNGDLIIPKNRYKNIVVTYPAFIPKAFQEKAQSIRNWMRSAKAYARLEDTYDMEHYRLGLASGIQSFEPVNRNDASNFQLSFDCKPQRFLKTGETPLPIEPEAHSYSGEIVEFETVAVDDMTKAEVSLSPIQSLNGYDHPWAGGAGENKFDPNTVTAGFIGSDGAINPQGPVYLEYISDYIPVSPSTQYTVMYSAYESGDTPYVAVCWYDSNKTFLRRDFRTTASYTNQSHENAAYCRAFMRTFGHGIDKCYFAVGTSTTFSPWQNLCPITGHTGATLNVTGENLFSSSFTSGKNIGADGEIVDRASRCATLDYMRVLPETEYTISYTGDGSNGIAFYDGLKNFLSILSWASAPRTFTTPANTQYLRVSYNKSTAPTDVQMEKGAIATTYDSNPTAYTATFGQTVYGGTFDFVSGKLVVTRVSVTFDNTIPSGSAGVRNITELENGVRFEYFPYREVGKAVNNFLSDKFALLPVGSGTPYRIEGSTKNPRMYMTLPSAYNTEASILEWFATNPTQVCYEIATPIEIDLDPTEVQTLFGLNNVWASDGTVEINYADPFNVDNPTHFEARPLFEITNPAQGDILNVNGNSITFVEGYTGTVYIDCETMDCFSGYTNLNYLISATDFTVLNEGLNIVTWSGTGSCKMTPRWWEL